MVFILALVIFFPLVSSWLLSCLLSDPSYSSQTTTSLQLRNMAEGGNTRGIHVWDSCSRSPLPAALLYRECDPSMLREATQISSEGGYFFMCFDRIRHVQHWGIFGKPCFHKHCNGQRHFPQWPLRPISEGQHRQFCQSREISKQILNSISHVPPDGSFQAKC